jgi:hypothetical protein
VAFLFRKYTEGPDAGDVSQADATEVESEEKPVLTPPEFRLFPPSPKAQIILIGVGFFLLNAILIAIWAIALYMNRS